MRPAGALVPPLADHLAVANEHGAYDGVRVGRPAPALGERKRPFHVLVVAHGTVGGESPVRLGGIVGREHRAAGDDQVGARRAHRPRRSRP